MLDWDDLRFFLAVVRHRTLSSAAKRLQVTQSTVGRRLAAMQQTLGVQLLQRTAEGFQLTQAGEAILTTAERVEAAAMQVEQTVSGRDIRLEGIVRVAISPLIASQVLAPCLAAMNSRNPAIRVEVLACPPAESLTRHQADISIQLTRFEQADVLMRSLGTIRYGLYASRAYLEKSGMPDLEAGCSGHRVVSLLDEVSLPQHASWLAEYAGRAQVVLKSDSADLQFAAVLHGSGLALLPRFRADREAGLQALAASTPVPVAEIWLGATQENRHNRRVRTVLDGIAATLRARAADLDPDLPENFANTAD